MRIANLSTYAGRGGAARASYRLHREFLRQGADSQLYYSQDGITGDPTVICLAKSKSQRLRRMFADYLERLWLGRNRPANDNFHANAWRHFDTRSMERIQEADIVCLYWIAGVLTPAQISEFAPPVVWRLSDCWPFTGGCHYPGACRRFEVDCGRCPVLRSRDEGDLAFQCQVKKQSAYRRKKITVVAPSLWIAQEARCSKLFKNADIRIIATGVDTNLFQPGPRTFLRNRLGLPEDAIILLTGSQNPKGDSRKGLAAVLAALRQVSDLLPRKTLLAVFGTHEPIKDSPIEVRSLGSFADDLALSDVYGAANVFIVASNEDNLPNTVLEAMSCGLPVAGFAAGGVPEVVRPGETGWLAPVGDTSALARAILSAATAEQSDLGKRARALIVRDYNLHRQGRKFLDLFATLCE